MLGSEEELSDEDYCKYGDITLQALRGAPWPKAARSVFKHRRAIKCLLRPVWDDEMLDELIDVVALWGDPAEFDYKMPNSRDSLDTPGENRR